MSGWLYRIRALLFVVVLILSLIVFVPILLLTFPAPVQFRVRFSNLWMHFTAWSLRWIGGIRARFSGMQHITGAANIYFVKHQSTLETFLLQPNFPPYVWVIKKQLCSIPVFGWGLALIGPIAIDRSAGRSAVSQVVEQGKQRLADGLGVLIFPEGTRTPPGGRGRYKLGGGLLAVAARDYPVIPVAHNAGLFWPTRKYLLGRPGTVDFSVGPPIDPNGLTAEQVVAKAEAWIEAESDRLAQEAQARWAQAPGRVPDG